MSIIVNLKVEIYDDPVYCGSELKHPYEECKYIVACSIGNVCGLFTIDLDVKDGRDLKCKQCIELVNE